jgi:superfamily I DNA/RNA helicase
MELRDDVESEYEKDKNKVSLMTLHACKGLEFPAVIMVGLEEDILPHKTLGSDIDEERTSCFMWGSRGLNGSWS